MIIFKVDSENGKYPTNKQMKALLKAIKKSLPHGIGAVITPFPVKVIDTININV